MHFSVAVLEALSLYYVDLFWLFDHYRLSRAGWLSRCGILDLLCCLLFVTDCLSLFGVWVLYRFSYERKLSVSRIFARPCIVPSHEWRNCSECLLLLRDASNNTIVWPDWEAGAGSNSEIQKWMSLFVGLRKCPVQSGLKLIGTLLLLAHESLAPFGFCKQNCGVSSIYAIGKMQAVLVTSHLVDLSFCLDFSRSHFSFVVFVAFT
ncbi:hypothetical protein Tco_1314346 [Tanacetum coccineum]